MFNIVDIALSTISIHYGVYFKGEYFFHFFHFAKEHITIFTIKNHIAIYIHINKNKCCIFTIFNNVWFSFWNQKTYHIQWTYHFLQKLRIKYIFSLKKLLITVDNVLSQFICYFFLFLTILLLLYISAIYNMKKCSFKTTHINVSSKHKKPWRWRR